MKPGGRQWGVRRNGAVGSSKEGACSRDLNQSSGSKSTKKGGDVGTQKESDAAISGTIQLLSSYDQASPVGIKKRKRDKKDSRESAEANENLDGIRKGIAEENQLMLEHQKSQKEEQRGVRDIQLWNYWTLRLQSTKISCLVCCDDDGDRVMNDWYCTRETLGM